MAYAAVVTFFPALGLSGPVAGRCYQITIAETEGATTSEATIPLLRQCSVRLLRADLTKAGGTGATFNPRVGPATAPDGFNGGVLVIPAATGASASPISREGSIGAVLTTAASGALFHRSTPNAGADNAITTKYWVEVLP